MTKLLVLVIAAALFLPLLLLVALSGVLLRTLGWALPSPRNLFGLVFDRDTKRNLALAHTTVNLLENEHGPSTMIARPSRDGFFLDRSPYSQQVVGQAAVRARQRLLAGERRLRIARRHVGSTVIGVSIAWLLVVGLLLGAEARPGDALIAMLLLLLLNGPLGRLAQRLLTTRADVRRVQIGACQPVVPSSAQLVGDLLRAQPTASYWVSTFPMSAAGQAASATDGRVQVTVRPVSPDRRPPAT